MGFDTQIEEALHALEAALVLADEVIALTMGPPRAEEVLREAIARGAHDGVLVVDRLLAGSDTWATANALAAAIGSVGDVDLAALEPEAMTTWAEGVERLRRTADAAGTAVAAQPLKR